MRYHRGRGAIMSERMLLLVLVFSLGGCLNWGVEEPERDGGSDGDADADGLEDADFDADLDAEVDEDADADQEGSTTCGDRTCEGEESAHSCPEDCPASCGDGECTHTEDAISCADDCPAFCGDSHCTHDEDAALCPGDCRAECGDSFCTHAEAPLTCPEDCSPECGDGACTHDEDDEGSAAYCVADCPLSCGNELCDLEETSASCPDDCPADCGDGLCTHEEDADSCPDDCLADCGDGFCTHEETNATCPDDCEAVCGDGFCNPGEEDATSCEIDCPADCGDGACTHSENACGCPADCDAECSDSCCTHDEDACSCRADCSAICGDGCCTHAETNETCARDCEAECGDGHCALDVEGAASCESDCPAVCGDGTVTHEEECEGTGTGSCPTSCGSIGTRVCVDCEWSECEPPAEVCNGRDDDCDDEVDDGANACGGVCELTHTPGTSCDGPDDDLCEDDEYECTGLNATFCSTGEDNTETCNDVDDDCDGETDEGENACGGVCDLPNLPGDACDGADTDDCEDDEYECAGLNDVVCSIGPDAIEECNREDDDCDSEIDEGCEPPEDVTALLPWNGHLTGSVWAIDEGLLVQPRRPRFSWIAAAGSTDYEIQIDDSCATPGFTDCAFDSPEVSVVVIGTNYTSTFDLPVSIVPPVGRRYYWRVRACNGTACSAWSSVRYVDVGRTGNDFNGDGYSDILVGAPGNDGAFPDGGRAYVFFGGGDMDTTADWTFNGEYDRNSLGRHVSGVSDVNADGYADFIVSAPGNDGSWTDAGRVYLVLGRSDSLGSPSDVFNGDTNFAQLGSSGAGAGDVNGDGFADIILGAEEYTGEDYRCGRAYLHLGAEGGPDTAADVVYSGLSGNGFYGRGATGIGDVNGDGFSDLILGGFEEIVTGHEPPASIHFGEATPDDTADLELDGGDNFAQRAPAGGDLNGDGYSDVAVYDNPRGWSHVAIFWGAPSPDSTPDLVPRGPVFRDNFGWAVAPGDVNGDGVTDLLVGASGPPSRAGSASIFLGGTEFDETADVVFHGVSDGDALGSSVSLGGDVDGDGYEDVIIGVPQNNASGRRGQVYVFFGGSEVDTISDLVLNGEASDDSFGYSVGRPR